MSYAQRSQFWEKGDKTGSAEYIFNSICIEEFSGSDDSLSSLFGGFYGSASCIRVFLSGGI